jgi:hypothetical protein
VELSHYGSQGAFIAVYVYVYIHIVIVHVYMYMCFTCLTVVYKEEIHYLSFYK